MALLPDPRTTPNTVKIVFVSEHPESDATAVSGIPFHMLRYLRMHADVVGFVHAPIVDLYEALGDSDRGYRQWADRAAQVSRAVAASECDLVVASGTSCVPASSLPVPLVVWHDSTWQTLLGSSRAELSVSAPFLLEWDDLVLQRADLVVYGSNWIRAATLRAHDLSPQKLAVVPFGPSLTLPLQEDVQQSIAHRRASTRLELTFIGADWRRKGLREAYTLLNRLRAAGVAATLNVVGPELTPDAAAGTSGSSWTSRTPFYEDELLGLRLRADPAVRLHGRIDTTRLAEQRHLEEVLRSSHFLVHPARAECTGIAVLEALAFGVPVLAVDRQGPRDAVSHDVNGALFGLANFAADAETWIRMGFDDPARYERLVTRAYDTAFRSLCWERSVPQFLDIVAQRFDL